MTLGKLGDERAKEPLQAMLAGTKEDDTRLLAASGLLSLKDEKTSLPVLADLMADGSTSVKEQAFKALERHVSRDGVLEAVFDKCAAAPYRVPDLMPRIRTLCDGTCSRRLKVRKKTSRSGMAKNAFDSILRELKRSP